MTGISASADRVTAVEVFFDLVFAFTLTQLTRTLEADFTWAGAGRLLLVFAPLWYMYGGYAWLNNHVPPRRASQKLALFGGMVGFFLMAVSIPSTFDGTGWLFGLGYLLAIVIHIALFSQSDAVAAVRRLVPWNIGGALMILGSTALDGAAMYLLWIGGYLLMTVVPYLVPRLSWLGVAPAFHVAAEHFVERNGLLVMIALGESVIAIGMGVDMAHVTALTVVVIALALALPGSLWWTYFTDNAKAEHRLGALEGGARSVLALRAYYFAHIPVMLGIVIAAAGIHTAVGHPNEPAGWPAATALAAGVALFMVGIADFRGCMAIGSPWSRVVAAAVALATIPIGVTVTAGWHLSAVLAVVVVMLVVTRGDHHSPVAN